MKHFDMVEKETWLTNIALIKSQLISKISNDQIRDSQIKELNDLIEEIRTLKFGQTNSIKESKTTLASDISFIENSNAFKNPKENKIKLSINNKTEIKDDFQVNSVKEMIDKLKLGNND